MTMDRDDRELRQGLRHLADAIEARALDDTHAAAAVARRLRRGTRARGLAVAFAAVVLVAVSLAGYRAFTAPVGEPAVEIPDLVGVFVSDQPGADGRCFAVRLYPTTVEDGRVAMWSWTGLDGCSARSDALATAVGTARGVRLPATGAMGTRAGVLVEAQADARPPMAGVGRVLDPGDDLESGTILAFPTLDDASRGTNGILLHAVERLDVPFRAG